MRRALTILWGFVMALSVPIGIPVHQGDVENTKRRVMSPLTARMLHRDIRYNHTRASMGMLIASRGPGEKPTPP